ncbi:MAG: hypothetical protein VR64_17300 [Desulfatitalea sp. BRH_c12]|nr:MAG: hypothetical protein VR64_17300 [Desulfatitalea sp. BRH_c12]
MSDRQLNSGLLIIRLSIAVGMLYQALPRLLHGARAWTLAGREFRILHGDLSAQIVGLTLLVVEVLASIGLISGYLFRLSAALLAGVYGLYFFNYLNAGYRSLYVYAGMIACICIGLLLSGPGRYAVYVKIKS